MAWKELSEEAKKYQKDWHRRRYLNIKFDCLLNLGGKCACCGETEPLFLEVDHINNNGKIHRKTMHKIYEQIAKKQIDLNHFQCLCANCNHGRHRNGGICPHKHKTELIKDPKISKLKYLNQ